MNTYTALTRVSHEDVLSRMAEVDECERFSVFKFTIDSENEFNKMIQADQFVVFNKTHEYICHIEDWDDCYVCINIDSYKEQ